MPATSFSEMPTLASSSTSPAPQPFHRRRKSWARKLERCCWTTFSHFPLVFVYGLTTWAVWVHVTVSLLSAPRWYGYAQAALGVIFYSLANLSYTIAVFNGAGSPLDPKQDLSKRRKTGGYENLPTYEHEEDGNDEAVPREWMTTVTAKSTGRPRYCKKCRVVKPDRTHHCSTCGRCVLKMDHHCPWLATCVGLRNYKPFLLFLIYTCLFCWLCFAVSAYWVWIELTNSVQMTEGLRVINTLLLTMLSGIIGLVLSGFTAWHLYLTVSGQTTIESLEKTRYLSPLRKTLQTQSQTGRNPLGKSQPLFSGLTNSDDQPLAERLKEIHANALPGVLRPEEGEITLDSAHPPHHSSHTPSPDSHAMASAATNSLQRSYASMEAQRERDRYNMYLDEQDSEKLPNAFNLGWQRNLLHVFGPQPLLWPLPVCNTTGDGWHWDVSPAWVEARDRIGHEREQHERQHQQQQHPGHRDPQRAFEPPSQRRPPGWKWNAGAGFVDHGHATPPLPPSSSGPPVHARSPAHGNTSVQMQALDRRKAGSGTEDLVHEDIDDADGRIEGRAQQRQSTTENWNDLPDEFLVPKNGASQRSHSQGRRKGD